jgi:hypothetical protein
MAHIDALAMKMKATNPLHRLHPNAILRPCQQKEG